MINKCLTGKASGFDRPRLALLQVLWGMITNANVDYVDLIWEDFKFQIDSRQINAKKKELLPFPRFTKLIIKYILSYHNNVSKRPQSYQHVMKLDAVIGNLKFVNKGKKDLIYGMAILKEMMSDEIKASADYFNYLAKKASKDDYIIKQHPKGPGEGSSVVLDIHGDQGASYGNLSSKSDDEEGFMSTNDEESQEKSDDERMMFDNSDVDAWKKQAEKIHVADPKKKKSEIPPSPSQTLSSAEYGTQLTNDNVVISMNDILQDPVETETQTMVEVPIHEENPAIQETQLVNVVSKKPEEKVDADVVLKRLIKLEKKVAAMSKIDHTNAIENSVQANVINEVKNQLPKYLLKAVFEYVQPRMESTDPPADADKDTKKRKGKHSDTSSSKKGKDQAKSSKEAKALSKLSATEKAVDDEELIQDNAVDDEELVQDNAMDVKDMTHDDAAPNQDKSKWFKQDDVVRPETPDPDWFKEPNANDAPEKNWFNELVNAEKDPKEFDDLMGSTIDFTKFANNCLKKDKIMKADLEGPAFTLLKGNYKNSIELEYNMEQCYLALTDQIDWVNPEGGRCPYDLSKPLPLQGPPGRTTILVDFFFNKDLEYLKTGNKEKKYASLVTKPKAARYELEGLEEMIPKLWSLSKVQYDLNTALGIHHWGPKRQLFYRVRHVVTSRHKVFSRMKILSVIRMSIDKQFGYGYLKEIVVGRADQQEYTFNEANFPRLHLNDIEDMFLLYVQNKLHHLKGNEQVDLVNALRLFTRRIVLKKRVEDVQLGVEIYKMKLIITMPQNTCVVLKSKNHIPYCTNLEVWYV
ncbi:hypothetical protein Tco_1191721 [Tanacetum coccineum]